MVQGKRASVSSPLTMEVRTCFSLAHSSSIPRVCDRKTRCHTTRTMPSVKRYTASSHLAVAVAIMTLEVTTYSSGANSGPTLADCDREALCYTTRAYDDRNGKYAPPRKARSTTFHFDALWWEVGGGRTSCTSARSRRPCRRARTRLPCAEVWSRGDVDPVTLRCPAILQLRSLMIAAPSPGVCVSESSSRGARQTSFSLLLVPVQAGWSKSSQIVVGLMNSEESPRGTEVDESLDELSSTCSTMSFEDGEMDQRGDLLYGGGGGAASTTRRKRVGLATQNGRLLALQQAIDRLETCPLPRNPWRGGKTRE